jgi:hypothetical protein
MLAMHHYSRTDCYYIKGQDNRRAAYRTCCSSVRKQRGIAKRARKAQRAARKRQRRYA